MGNDFKDLFGDSRPDENGPAGDDRLLPEPENRIRRALNEKECKVVNVFKANVDGDGNNSQTAYTFVLLRDNRGRHLRIFVVPDLAFSILLAKEDEKPERPITHDLMKTIIEKLGASIERITIDDLWGETFYSRITINHNGETMDIDSRPSDAIAMALRFHAPIYVAESVLESANIETQF